MTQGRTPPGPTTTSLTKAPAPPQADPDTIQAHTRVRSIFLGQAFDAHLGLTQQLAIVGVLMLTSKGMAGVPGSSFLALSATAAALGAYPVAGVALLLGADRIIDSMRVFINLLGNCLATFVVAKSEGQLDIARMNAVLNGHDVEPLDDLPLVSDQRRRELATLQAQP